MENQGPKLFKALFFAKESPKSPFETNEIKILSIKIWIISDHLQTKSAQNINPMKFSGLLKLGTGK
jgi:hypothetical protein